MGLTLIMTNSYIARKVDEAYDDGQMSILKKLGINHEITFEHMKPIQVIESIEGQICYTCGGEGEYNSCNPDNPEEIETCDECHGSGWKKEEKDD